MMMGFPGGKLGFSFFFLKLEKLVEFSWFLSLDNKASCSVFVIWFRLSSLLSVEFMSFLAWEKVLFAIFS
jgi:hypothetical protein